MGGDGQALLNSRKLLENLYRRQQSDAANVSAVDRQNRLQCCAMSHNALVNPVCVDLRGNLYNRTAVVEYLLDRKSTTSALTSDGALVEKLKDVRPVVQASDGDTDDAVGAPFELVCSETGKRSAGGRFPFACRWTCGHVICAGEGADLLSKSCPVCGPSAEDENVWVRLGLESDAANEQRAMLMDIVRPKKRPRDQT
jgi:hypothetical protein